VRKCPYCDFNSHAVPLRGIPEDAYLAALLDDLEFATRDGGGRPLVSVFFGGGTPSLFSAASIGRIVERATQMLGAAEGLEVTLEANPGTVERGRFAAYRDAGVTRVSLGAQSFNDRHLEALGRIHASEETRAAVDELRAAGLGNIYVCEALWRAGISPLRLARDVTPAETERLVAAIRAVLADAIAAGGLSPELVRHLEPVVATIG
jgi:oxygen-independent coproporphyrinogen-3 oxidase